MRRGALIKAQINDENVFLLEQSRQALTASERRFRDVIEATTDWIWEADSEARLTWLSDRFPALPVIILTTGLGGTCWISSTATKSFSSLAAESADEQ